MPYYSYFDIGFLIFVIPALIISLITQFRMRSTYRRMAQTRSLSGLNGAQAAARVLAFYGVNNVRIEAVSGKLTDHYDPRANVIRLSQDVYNSNSIASIGIACHEAGHAAQYAQGYAPIRVRNAILPVCNIGSTLSFPLILLGFFLSFQPLVTAGLALFSLIVVFQLITLPVEFNASNRALQVIEETGMLQTGEELRGAQKVLSAAAMTYVAALITSIAQLLRLFLLYGRRNRR